MQGDGFNARRNHLVSACEREFHTRMCTIYKPCQLSWLLKVSRNFANGYNLIKCNEIITINLKIGQRNELKQTYLQYIKSVTTTREPTLNSYIHKFRYIHIYTYISKSFFKKIGVIKKFNEHPGVKLTGS